MHASGEGGNRGAEGFWSGLFEVFTPRQVCMNGENDVVWLHVVSDGLIALAYFSIPLALICFVRQRKDLAFNWMFVLFAAFILLCGTTHVMGIVAIWRPYYRVDGLVKLATGVVSVMTAVLLWPLIRKAILLPSPAQLRAANERLNSEVVERMKAEEGLRRSAEVLEERVKERTAELSRAAAQRAELLESERYARAEAERANRVKDDFVATLSHELRTPISSILGWTHVLRQNPGRPDAGYGLDVIERNTRAQARMIDDLLDMSRIVAGKLRLEVQSVDLGAVVLAAAETVRPAAEAKGVRVETQIDQGAGPVRGDPSRLQQIVWNLLSNAVKFTPAGGAGVVRVSLARFDGQVEVRVEDNGKGIGAEFLPYLFDRFRQEDSSTTRAHGGLGLGLSIVRHLVELHGGTVSARSEGDGRGSVFSVLLPVRDRGAEVSQREAGAMPAAVKTEKHDEVPQWGETTLLLVDDDKDNRELLALLFKRAGAQVEVACSSAEGLALLGARGFTAIVSDIGMPDEDGYGFIRKVRAKEAAYGDSRVPAVALTAFARSEDREKALTAGFDAHIAKPADPDELGGLLARLIETGKV